MKLFLSSISIAPANRQAFLDLVGKPARDIRVAVIENGADTYTDDHKQWVTTARNMISDTVGEIVAFDLRTYSDHNSLKEDLSRFDVIWVGGGNVFYLRWLSRETGFDKVIKELVESGTVYGGDSAGAIIAGPTIDGFQPADDPDDAPEIILDAYSLTDIVVVPHYDSVKYGPIMKGIEKELLAESHKSAALGDRQAIVIDGDTHVIVG